MIKIIAGTFGWNNGDRIIPYTEADGAVDLKDPELEARLVKQGVAEYTDGTSEQTDETSDDDPNKGDGEQPPYNKDMKLAELQEVAKAYGVDASGMRTKDVVIAAIEAAKAAQVDDEDDSGENEELPDDGEQPDLGTADPEVQT